MVPPLVKKRAAIAILVKDHMDHGVGCTDAALDVKERVDWAWNAVKSSPSAKRKKVMLLALDVAAGTVNGRKDGKYPALLRQASSSASRLLPLLAQSWDPDAPTTLRGNLSAKLGEFEKLKRKSISSIRRRSVGSTTSSADQDDEDEDCTVADACSLPMSDLKGAKRAAQAMLIASVFAAEVSMKERVAVLVLGRPPGHHATCSHQLALAARPVQTPGGAVEGASLGGGCFYPSCWLAAVHCLKEGFSKRLAYIDIDAHKPDGVWKEVDHLCRLGRDRRAAILGSEKADACEGILFASIHVDGYPNPGLQWTSADCVLPKATRRAFEVRVHEELLSGGIATGALQNEDVWAAFGRWQSSLSKDTRTFRPNGIFVGLGFDLHKLEKRIGDKKAGVGLLGQHYFQLLRSLPASSLKGPFVLTLEGGYTQAAINDGIHGALSGLEALSVGRALGNSLQRAIEKKSNQRASSSKSKSRSLFRVSKLKCDKPRQQAPQSTLQPQLELDLKHKISGSPTKRVGDEELWLL